FDRGEPVVPGVPGSGGVVLQRSHDLSIVESGLEMRWADVGSGKASTKPRPFDRGENKSSKLEMRLYDELQASHDLSIVESFVWGWSTCLGASLLQRSHDLSIVESALYLGLIPAALDASTKPRPFDRGEPRANEKPFFGGGASTKP